MLLSSMLLVLGAFASGCKDKEPELLPVPITIVTDTTATPTVMDEVMGVHTNGHCTYWRQNRVLNIVEVDTTFETGTIEITRVNDLGVRAAGHGWQDLASFRMPVGSTDTMFYGVGHTMSSTFGITINLNARTISTGYSFSYPSYPTVSTSTGFWKF